MERNVDPVKPRRRYDATQRRAQSRAARRTVLATAGQLFAERGYQRTSMRDIAAGAGVSVETVYGYFGTKSGLLKELLDVTVAGGDAPVSVPERAPIQAVRDAPDGRASWLTTRRSWLPCRRGSRRCSWSSGARRKPTRTRPTCGPVWAPRSWPV